ncbi:uncharacterized protein RSE6_08174 [Rhynchosporium secalis]|uniref:DUF3533 domain-containing protein n=1 Tax=Rhynchosporium secalis TaxID=38038 RepID=A0A1E1MES5_RHYSE|nr:uncharacterized protein RSE6_08174 [Rhynchosporium secalis]
MHTFTRQTREADSSSRMPSISGPENDISHRNREAGLVKHEMLLKFHPTSIYPKANQQRIHGHNKAIRPVRVSFLKAAGINFLLLQILFFALFVYIFGALYQQTDRIHALEILFVDYDGGSVGHAVREAYGSLQGKTFPTLNERPANQFQMGSLREHVCQAHYWAAFYISPGASDRLESALGGIEVPSYDRSDVLTYVWNEARYPAIVDSAISANLKTLSAAARVFYTTNSTFGLVNSTNSNSVVVFANPWTLTDINIQPTSQGSRLIYNTIVIILILIQEFFYLGTINGLYAQFKIYNKLYPHRIIAYRFCISLAYCFIGSLCVTGSIWAFRAGWDVNGAQFVLTWLILWLFAHLNFLAMDLFTVWLQNPYVPMALIAWVMLNVTTILLPFELSNGFYRWGYALPAHEVYQILLDIWSGGCNPKLHYALPLLFVWELIGLVFSALGIYKRCHYARVAEEAQEAILQQKADAALAFEKKHDQERDDVMEARQSRGAEEEHDKVGEVPSLDRLQTVEREKIEEAIRDEDNILRKEQTRASKTCNFGPSFGFASYADEGSDTD